MSNLSTYHLFPIVMTVVILKLCGKHKTRLLKPNQTLGLPYGFLVMKYLKEVVQHTTYFPSASDPDVIWKLGGNCKTRLLKPNGTLGLPYGFYIMFSIWVSMIGYVDIPPQTQMAAMPTQLDNEQFWEHTTYFPLPSHLLVIWQSFGYRETRLLKPNGALGLPYGV